MRRRGWRGALLKLILLLLLLLLRLLLRCNPLIHPLSADGIGPTEFELALRLLRWRHDACGYRRHHIVVASMRGAITEVLCTSKLRRGTRSTAEARGIEGQI